MWFSFVVALDSNVVTPCHVCVMLLLPPQITRLKIEHNPFAKGRDAKQTQQKIEHNTFARGFGDDKRASPER